MASNEPVSELRTRLLAQRAANKDIHSREFQIRMARMDESFARLEAERASVRPVQCETCGDLKLVSVEMGDEQRPRAKLVPCPDCQTAPTPSEAAQLADDLEWLDAYYAAHGATQGILDMGDEEYGD